MSFAAFDGDGARPHAGLMRLMTAKGIMKTLVKYSAAFSGAGVSLLPPGVLADHHLVEAGNRSVSHRPRCGLPSRLTNAPTMQRSSVTMLLEDTF